MLDSVLRKIRLRTFTAHLLLFALFLAFMPQPVQAKWQNLQSTLPGIGMSTSEEVGIIAAGGAAAAVVVLMIVKHKRKQSNANLAAPAPYAGDSVAGQLGRQSVAPANLIRSPGQVSAVAAEDAPADATPAPGQLDNTTPARN